MTAEQERELARIAQQNGQGRDLFDVLAFEDGDRDVWLVWPDGRSLCVGECEA